jgi:hypothetical protein
MKKPNHQILRRYLWQIILVVGVFASICLVPCAHALIIYPDNPYWQATYKDRASKLNSSGKVYISGNNPRSGNASLALKIIEPTKPDETIYDEWAFYNRYAPSTSSWGKLSEVSAISFDWYRQAIPGKDYGAPWAAQTPVLRLYIEDNGVLSELIWEKYYKDTSPAKTGEWVTQDDVMNQNLWRHFLPDGNSGNAYADSYTFNTSVTGAPPFDGPFPDGQTMPPLMTNTRDSWLLQQPSGLYSYSAQASVYGIGVGVGSFWPDQYVGYVDNLMLDYNGVTFVNDNF